MASLTDKRRVERQMMDLITESGTEPPDAIEYGYGCVRFIWTERKLAVVIDIDPPARSDLDSLQSDTEP